MLTLTNPATIPEETGWKPPAPRPREKIMSSIEMLLVARRNPLEMWNRIHFAQKFVSGRNLMGDAVVMMDPVGIRHVLLDNAANYPKDALQRRTLGAGQGRGDGLLVAEGDLWKRTRRTVAPLFTPRRIAGFLPQMREAADKMAASLARKPDGYPFDAALAMTRVTFDVLSATLFSNGVDNREDRFGNAMSRYLEATGQIDPLDILNAPKWLPRLSRIQARPAQKFFEKNVDEIIATRRTMIAKGEEPPADLLTALLKAADPESGQGLSDGEVASNIITFIGAGHETTANTLTWAIYLVSQSSQVRDELEAELALHDLGALEAGDLFDCLPFTRAVIEEAMRLYPPAPILSRGALEADNVAGCAIPKGATVYMPPYVLHRHKLLWDEPDYFRPHRFLPGKREAIDRFAYLPFGAGPRVCVAAQFALMEAVIVFAVLMKAVRLDYAGDTPPRPLQRITLRPADGMNMRVRSLK